MCACSSGPDDGPLAGMRKILKSYFAAAPDPSMCTDPAEPELVQSLYRPLHEALCGMTAPSVQQLRSGS